MVEFEGAYFVPAGPYKHAIIRFLLSLPEGYPEAVPTIRVLSRLFHPLLDADKAVCLAKGLAGRTRICHVLAAFAQCFDELFLYELKDDECTDREALAMLKTNRIHYDELLAGCIQESVEFARTCRTGVICLGAAPPPSGQSLGMHPMAAEHQY